MKATYDEQANALYVRFTDAAVEMSEEVRNGLVIDFDADGRIVAFEMLGNSPTSRSRAASRKASGTSKR